MIGKVSGTPEGRHWHTWRREVLLLMVAGVFVSASAWALAVTLPTPFSVRTGVNPDPLLLLCIALWFGAAITGFIGLQHLGNGHDVILFPSVMILCGWGIVTIWRLQGVYALRQAFWVCIGTGVMLVTVRWFHWIIALRKYPYVALLFGALLTSLTLIVGVNPSGSGPRLWLGVGGLSFFGSGIYLQPSELLKPLLVIFLAAYLSRHGSLLQYGFNNLSSRLPMAFLAPMVVMWSLSLFMVIVQRDMGAGWVLYWGFLCIFYLATGRRRYVALGMVLFLIGAALAYFVSELARSRIHGWLNPWSDANGEYYQIVQALKAMATGGTFGTGIGRGAPEQIPLAHSDFILAAIINEWGKMGGFALFILTLIILERIWVIGYSQGTGSYLRLLVFGVGSFIAVQAVINISGVLRMMPLTGVPLPFVSYGGSSMVVNFAGIGVVYGYMMRGMRG